MVIRRIRTRNLSGLMRRYLYCLIMNDRGYLIVYRLKLLPIMFFLMIIACAVRIGPPPPPAPCPIENLILEEASFHNEIHQTGPASKSGAPMRFGVNKLGVGFTSMTQGGATQDVYEGRSILQTQEKFTEQIDVEFSNQKGYTEWYTPTDFNYYSSVADQIRFACRRHEASNVENCRAIGQYNVYLIILDVDISSFLTYRDMARLLQTIDVKVTQCLGK